MKFHPACEAFPLMNEAELADLAADIKAHGMYEPIVREKSGAIIDGRNRYLACKAVKVKPTFDEYTGNGVVEYVVSMNLKRRHMNESQRAMVATALANLRDGQKRADVSIDTPAVTRSDAAKLLNVSVPTVARAARIRASGTPELVKAVESGDVSVGAGSEIATWKPAEQRKAIAKGPKHATEAAAERRKDKIEKARDFDFKGQIAADPQLRWTNYTTRLQQVVDNHPGNCIAELPAAKRKQCRADLSHFIKTLEALRAQL